MDNILIHYEDIKGITEFGNTPLPYFADLHLSNTCQMHCQGCAYGGLLDGDIMLREDAFKVVKDLMDLGVKAFDFAGGGEPLLLPYFKDLAQFVIDHNCFYGVITNGLSLVNDKPLREFILRTATYVRISFEATTADGYASYKRSRTDTFEDLVAVTKKMIRYKEDTKCANADISIKFAVGKSLRGYKHYKYGLIMANSLKVDSVQFKALRHEPEELTPSEKEFEASVLHACTHTYPCNVLRSWIKEVPEKDIPQCTLNPLHAVVDYDGSFYLCCYYYYRKEAHTIGNILKENIQDIWGSQKHKELIKNIDKQECAKVDCKFFRHHKVVNDANNNGKVWFL